MIFAMFISVLMTYIVLSSNIIDFSYWSHIDVTKHVRKKVVVVENGYLESGANLA